jgi:CRP/FNR family transcriptional regulator, anaerobic regulatory protein
MYMQRGERDIWRLFLVLSNSHPPLLIHEDMPRRLEFQRELALGRRELIARFQSGSLQVLRAGHLFRGGQPDVVLYRLRDGWAYRFRDLADGHRAIVDVYVPGDIIGLDALLRKTNVRTLTTASVEIIVAKQSMAKLLTEGCTAFYIWRLLSEHQLRADRLVTAISSLDARGRLATMLLDFYHRLEIQKLTTSGSFNLPLTQQQIANFLGMTVVHVNRVLHALRDDQTIKVEKHRVTILDLSTLADLAKVDVRLYGATKKS